MLTDSVQYVSLCDEDSLFASSSESDDDSDGHLGDVFMMSSAMLPAMFGNDNADVVNNTALMDQLVAALGHQIKSKLSMKLEDIFYMSLPKLSSQDDDGPTSQGHQYSGVVNFEPIPHDHDFCVMRGYLQLGATAYKANGGFCGGRGVDGGGVLIQRYLTASPPLSCRYLLQCGSRVHRSNKKKKILKALPTPLAD
ncbi:hypothetical protein GE061_005534 [Apolygus lucorum]|uniref:Uncharacterized protein n=1 Tax=Apolygus lucorum TaxID=248454 RepID=A0A8S9WWJ8_APOLU|nr:hypothetical protein GE061_005534 [Apolygus lucorum]